MQRKIVPEEQQNLPKEFPVDTLLRYTGPAYEHNGSNQAVCGANGHSNLGGQ
jgi:hypothetical protein